MKVKIRTVMLIITVSLFYNLFAAPIVLATEVPVPFLEQNTLLEGDKSILEDTSLPNADSSISVGEEKEHSTISENTIDTISENDTSVEKDSQEITPFVLTTGVWGTSPVSYEASTRTLTVSAGTIDNTSTSLNPQSTIKINQINHIVFEDGVKAPENSSSLFSGLNRFNVLKSLTGNLDTSNVTDMSSMFSYTPGLNNADITNWDTSKVTDMSSMFTRSGLPLQDLNSWNTSNVTNMSSMFEYADNLTELNISDWDTSNVTNMAAMFRSIAGLNGIKNMNLNNWNTSNVNDMSSMFSTNFGLTSLNISNWNTSNVNDMSSMFCETISLTSLNISSWDTANVTNMNSMFESTALESLSIDNWDVSNVLDMGEMFASTSLKELNLSNWDTSKVTNMSGTFSDARVLSKLDILGWTISTITDTAYMFSNSDQLQTLIVGGKTQFSKSRNNGIEIFLPAIDTASGQYTGAWERVEPIIPISVYKSSYSFMTAYDGSQPGTYIWQKGKAKFSVDFNSNGGSGVPSQSVVSNETVTQPSNPMKDGYRFEGWYTDEALTQAFDFNAPIIQATTLYAKWVKNTDPIENYLITFNSNGGSVVASQSVLSNETATQPNSPTKDGYRFEGWYTDEALTQVFDFNTPITQALTLYAKWIKVDSEQKNESGKNTTVSNSANNSPNKSTDKQLPNTGEVSNTWLYALGTLLIFISVSFFGKRKKN